ncbi:PP2C-like domain-containing protein CG9801 [Ylistrum balloti]|uniref:PP2C-like domain-containing protein CG9801 n=1 Tax=Ylistrum balloti TaxID=509963 RepID=UPI002905C448|nr:PP2C-like domain-containing protein CG9801 [Ylistrum balloti]
MARFGNETFSGKCSDDLPLLDIGHLSDEVFSSYTGPDSGLTFAITNEDNGNSSMSTSEFAGVRNWNNKDQKAYGICISLYEQHPVNGKMSGDPLADAFAICARKNSCVMLIADGVNWGEKPRLAARCALYGSMNYINKKIFQDGEQPCNTQDVIELLRHSFDEAHRCILAKDGGLTTMCACMVVPVKNSEHFAVCCVNVGDSYAYVISHNQGIREVTVGSHDISSERDIRDAGGALGPVNGRNPELRNLTCSITFANQGDVVFLATDGISDNFDPVVTKLALPRRESDSNFNNLSPTSPTSSPIIRPEMDPKERHIYAMKEMERIIHEYELVTEEPCSAQELCGALVQHVLSLTDSKRKILENPALYVRRKMTLKDKERRDSEIVDKMGKAPGKLDHASVVAYEVGIMKPDEEEMENIPLGTWNGDDTLSLPSSTDTSPSPTSPISPVSKKSRPKKLFARIRSLSVNTTNNSSPSHHHHHASPGLFPISPKRFSFKRSRSKSESEPVTPISPTNHSHKAVISPSPMTPPALTPEDFPMPLPAQHPSRRSISYESSV